MTAKEYLSQIRMLDIIIDQKKQELTDLHDIATSIGSFDYSSDRVQTSPKGEAPYARVAEKAAEIDEEIRRLEDERLEIIDSIRCLDSDTYIDVLYKLYVEDKSYETIAGEMDYSYDRIRHIHYEALDALAAKVSLL